MMHPDGHLFVLYGCLSVHLLPSTYPPLYGTRRKQIGQGQDSPDHTNGREISKRNRVTSSGWTCMARRWFSFLRVWFFQKSWRFPIHLANYSCCQEMMVTPNVFMYAFPQYEKSMLKINLHTYNITLLQNSPCFFEAVKTTLTMMWGICTGWSMNVSGKGGKKTENALLLGDVSNAIRK